MPSDRLRSISQTVQEPPDPTDPSQMQGAYQQGQSELQSMRSTLANDPSVMDAQYQQPQPAPVPKQPPTGPLQPQEGFLARGAGPTQGGQPNVQPGAPQAPPAPSFGETLAHWWSEFRPRLVMAAGVASNNPQMVQMGQQLWQQSSMRQALSGIIPAQQRFEAGDTQGAIATYDQWLQQAVQKGNIHPGAVQEVLKQRIGMGQMVAGISRLRNALSQVQDSQDPFQIVAAMSAGGVDPKIVQEYLTAIRTGQWGLHMDSQNGRVYRINNRTGEVDEVSNQLYPGAGYVNQSTITKEEHEMARSFSGGKFSDYTQLMRAAQSGDVQAKSLMDRIAQTRVDQITGGMVTGDMANALTAIGWKGSMVRREVPANIIHDAKQWLMDQATAGKVQTGQAMRDVTAATAAAVTHATQQAKREEILNGPIGMMPGGNSLDVFDQKTGRPVLGGRWNKTGRDIQSGSVVALRPQDAQLMRYMNTAEDQMDAVDNMLKRVYTPQDPNGIAVGTNLGSAVRMAASKTGIAPDSETATLRSLTNALRAEVGRIESGQARLLVSLLNLVEEQLPGLADNYNTAKSKMNVVRTQLRQRREELLQNPNVTHYGDNKPGWYDTVGAKLGISPSPGVDKFTTSSGRVLDLR